MQMIDEIDRAFDLARYDDAVRVVILAADGKHFSSGHDLKELVGPDADPDLRDRRSTAEGKFRHERNAYFDKCVRIYEFPKPTIAAVQGKCIAAGVMLAAMCDLIVASDDASFQNPVARMSGMGVELLVEPWELGIRKAKEFLLTGDAIDATEAWRLGMVNKVVPRAELGHHDARDGRQDRARPAGHGRAHQGLGQPDVRAHGQAPLVELPLHGAPLHPQHRDCARQARRT